LKVLLQEGTIVVDQGGEIISEYRRHCNPSGQPGVGDRFFQVVLMSFGARVERVPLTAHEARTFLEFPDDPELLGFDLSDRKFAAVARKAEVPVVNSTDTDWLEHRSALERNGVAVEFVCGASADGWFVAED